MRRGQLLARYTEWALGSAVKILLKPISVVLKDAGAY
jgi:hypothetical protein